MAEDTPEDQTINYEKFAWDGLVHTLPPAPETAVELLAALDIDTTTPRDIARIAIAGWDLQQPFPDRLRGELERMQLLEPRPVPPSTEGIEWVD